MRYNPVSASFFLAQKLPMHYFVPQPGSTLPMSQIFTQCMIASVHLRHFSANSDPAASAPRALLGVLWTSYPVRMESKSSAQRAWKGCMALSRHSVACLITCTTALLLTKFCSTHTWPPVRRSWRNGTENSHMSTGLKKGGSACRRGHPFPSPYLDYGL